MSLVRSRKVSRFRSVGAIGLSAALLGGCFATQDGRRSLFDHAHYTPVGDQAEDIFVDPVGSVDRTIPNRLGRLDVVPTNYSFETDQAARTRAKLTLPPQPQIPSPAVPKIGPQSGLPPGSQTDTELNVQPAAPNPPLRQRSPARPVAPGVTLAAPPQAQSGGPTLTDPIAGVVPQQGSPADKSWPATATPAVPQKP
jgi:hypothetical protein